MQSPAALDAIDPSETTGYKGGRLAVTVLLLRDGPEGIEVWVQERVSTMRNYPGHVVFPGGGVDRRDFPPRQWNSGEHWHGPSDVHFARRMGVNKYKAHALLFAAARELFEESGTLLARERAIDGGIVSDATRYHDDREALESHRISFTEFLDSHQLQFSAERLAPWARWVGVDRGQTFDTYFFVAVLPQGQTPDGATLEADDAGWFSPSLLLEGWRAGLVRLVIPTWAQLKRLAAYSSTEQLLADASLADLRPVVGDPCRAARYREFFDTQPTDRIK